MRVRGLWKKLLLQSLLLVLLFSLTAHAAIQEQPPLIEVKRDGTVSVLIKAVATSGLNAFPAPAPPLPATIAATLGGTAVPVVYDNNTIYIAADREANVTITYLVNVTARDGYAEFSIGQARVVLRLEPGVVLLSLPDHIEDVKQAKDGTLEILVRGPAMIRYTVAAAQAPATTTTARPATTTTTTPSTTTSTAATATTTRTTRTTSPPATATTETATTGTRGATSTVTTSSTTVATGGQSKTTAASPAARGGATAGPGGGANTALLLVAVIAVAAVVAAALLRGRRGQAPGGSPRGDGETGGAEAVELRPRGLDDVDRLILAKLREHGGSMLQSQLLRETGLPKTTLWRHVQKLEKMGIIEVVREGRSNRLILREGGAGATS